MHSSNFINKVKVVQKVFSISPNGQTITDWRLVNSLWACILELDNAVFQSRFNLSEQKLVKIIFRGRRTFNVEEIRFVHKDNIYKAIMQSCNKSRSDTPFTVVYCHKLDDVINIQDEEDILEAE